MKLGRIYGEKYFYKWWKKACESLGIKDVDLYGDTRHSSVVALREHFSPEQIKQGQCIKQIRPLKGTLELVPMM